MVFFLMDIFAANEDAEMPSCDDLLDGHPVHFSAQIDVEDDQMSGTQQHDDSQQWQE